MYKILCATDETEASRKAEKFAVRLAKALSAELCYLYVSPVTKDDLSRHTSTDVTILKVIEAREHSVLAHAEQAARDQGYQARCAMVRSHRLAKAIVAYAEKEGFDHIVTGSSGYTGIPRFVLGSTASDIIQRAHCPVTVVR